jgi:hypothetical protein
VVLINFHIPQAERSTTYYFILPGMSLAVARRGVTVLPHRPESGLDRIKIDGWNVKKVQGVIRISCLGTGSCVWDPKFCVEGRNSREAEESSHGNFLRISRLHRLLLCQAFAYYTVETYIVHTDLPRYLPIVTGKLEAVHGASSKLSV